MLRRFVIAFCGAILLLFLAHLATAQVPIARGFADYLIAYQTPAAPRVMTVSDPGGNDQFLFTNQAQTFANKGWNRPTNGGQNVTLGDCANGTLELPSTDFAGRITFSGVNASCAINFSESWGMNAPTCIVTTSGANAIKLCNKASTVNVTFVPNSNFANGDAVSYICVGHG